MVSDPGRYPLPSLERLIEARPELVFQLISAVGQGPDAGHARVVERPTADRAIVEFTTSVFGWGVRTLEEVVFFPPNRITYCLMRGPLPEVDEEFRLDPQGRGVLLRYSGSFRAHRVWPRMLLDRVLVPALYRRAVTKSMAEIKRAAEERQARSRAFPWQEAGKQRAD